MKWPFGERGETTSQAPRGEVARGSNPRDEILQGCWRVENDIYINSSTLPTLGAALALEVVDTERRICSLSTYLRADVEHTLSATVNNYIPTLLSTYLRATASGAREDEKFNEQIQVILESSVKVLQAVKNDNIQAMEAQSLFLDSKFGGSHLE